jgi:hypothetical protein
MGVAKSFVRTAYAGVESETGFLAIAMSQPRAERGIAGHWSPRTPIQGPVCPAPRGIAYAGMTTGRTPLPAEIASGLHPRNDSFELSYCRFQDQTVITFGNPYKFTKNASNALSCRRNRILSLKILPGYTACGPSVRPNAAEFGSIEASLGIATGLHHG